MPSASIRPRAFRFPPRVAAPYIGFIEKAVSASGCILLSPPVPDEFPFRFVLETSRRDRIGVVAYAFAMTASQAVNDAFAFSTKPPGRARRVRELWQDESGLHVTLLFGFDHDQGFFVGADAVLHSPLSSDIAFEIEPADIEKIQRDRWAAWEYSRDDGPIEVLLGAGPEMFLRYLLFEREALGEDQGHRHLLADKMAPNRGRLV